ncbi:antitoxin [Geodermatophilus sabuli]|uniref:Antitoxin n=1 Tax=Geodermatophilus sabuli TaxID=1564158 RepID=A0A7K3W5J7_9ACTN|nr:antitoxin [Geodermatophilus sabuli]NEK59980.1 antitoxin [Geodermatophilus sabuli]
MSMMDKAKDALSSDKGEQVSDKALDKGGDLADQKTGGDHDAQIDKGRDIADGKIGNQ